MIAHGTNAGYRHHRRLNQDACLPCRVAHNAYNTTLRREPSLIHGTTTGVRRHSQHGSLVCDACLDWACAIEADRRESYYARLRREDEAFIRGLPRRSEAA